MPGTLDDNTYSLSLAFDAREAVKSLKALRRGGHRGEQLKQAIEDVIASLDALNTGSRLFGHLSDASSFQSYEQIQTLQEVQAALSDDRLTEKLRNVITDSGGVPNESIDVAIQFFTALQNRALQRYNQTFGVGVY